VYLPATKKYKVQSIHLSAAECTLQSMATNYTMELSLYSYKPIQLSMYHTWTANSRNLCKTTLCLIKNIPYIFSRSRFCKVVQKH